MRPVLLLVSDHILRVDDNISLLAACSTGNPVIPVYIHGDSPAGIYAPGTASQMWRYRSVLALKQAYRSRGSDLLIMKGDPCEILPVLIGETLACGVYMDTGVEPWRQRLAAKVRALCHQLSLKCTISMQQTLLPVAKVKGKAGEPCRTFDAFSRYYETRCKEDSPQVAPAIIARPEVWPVSLPVEVIRPPSAEGGPVQTLWQPGEKGAHKRLGELTRRLCAPSAQVYSSKQNYTISKLSAPLHFGELSMRQLFDRIEYLKSRNPATSSIIEPLMRDLLWRDFSYYQLYHHPDLPTKPLRESFENFPWHTGPSENFERWTLGQTGYPIVDAGMRQLLKTGWMPACIRIIVASFLVKNLMIDWRMGARWFWDAAVDADMACNSMNWQTIAGCGVENNSFSVLHPVEQSEIFNPDGAYIVEYVPELSRLPASHIHNPGVAPVAILEKAGVELGSSYPAPIVDFGLSCQIAQEAFDQIAVRQ